MTWKPDWRPQIEAIALGHSIDTIVHIGISDDAALQTLLSAGARRVVLIEPDPDRAAILTHITAEHADVDVIAATPGKHSAQVTFLRLSLPEFSGLDVPEELMTLYPGLQVEARLEIPMLDVPALLDQARITPPPEGATHLAILDSPVAAARHAGLFMDARADEMFDRILIQTSRDGMGGPAADTLLERFANAGFLIQNIAHPDPDFMRADLAYPARLRSAEAAAGQLKQTQDSLQAARASLESLQHENAALTKAEDATRQDLRLALRMQAMLERDIAELRDRYSALHDTKEARDALLARLMPLLGRARDAVLDDTPPPKPPTP